MKFLPVDDPQGGSRIGNSYMACYAQCPRLWFNKYYRPTVDDKGQDTRGVSSRFTSPFLLDGRIFHEALAEWYLSGIRDGEDTGEYSIDRAMAKLALEYESCLRDFESSEQAENDRLMLEEMLRGYHDRFGPNSHSPDYPGLRVICDAQGNPLVEREFAIDLGHKGYVFTSRVDLIVWHNGLVKAMEHKTSVASFARQRLVTAHNDSQFTGEFLVLRSLFPEEPIEGILCNVILKKRAARSTLDYAVRDTIKKSDLDLESYRLACLDILQEIDARVRAYEDDLKLGVDTEVSVMRHFPDHGTRTGACDAYRGCEFLPLCSMKGREGERLRGYRARVMGG